MIGTLRQLLFPEMMGAISFGLFIQLVVALSLWPRPTTQIVFLTIGFIVCAISGLYVYNKSEEALDNV